MPQLKSSYRKRYGLNCRGVSTPLPYNIIISATLVQSSFAGKFLWPSISGPFLANPIRSPDVISHSWLLLISPFHILKKSCLFWLLGDLIILIPSQFNSVLFVLSLYACTAVPPHPTARFDSLGDVVSVSHLPSASTGHVGCCVICSLCHQEVWCQSSPAVCIARVLLLPWHLFLYTSWTLHFMNCIYKLSDLNFAGTGCPIL